MPEPLQSPLLDQARPQGIRHGFFTRKGGVSDGIYRGLNIGVGSADDQLHVAENRRRVAAWMGVSPEALLSAYQIHSPDVIVATEPFAAAAPEGRRHRDRPRRGLRSAPRRPIADRCCSRTRRRA